MQFPRDGVDFRDLHLHPTTTALPPRRGGKYGTVYRTLIDRG
jgi:hypothetical protein